ncbi:MAG: 50S ribosomal protein L20 [Candidatus Colwellbacteria bacterium]|nr:50S ribosomal protein L20 [Candidatus Colwellbacteria bacterium]
MARVKRGPQATKTRRNLLKRTKGYRWDRKSKERPARQAVLKAGTYAYRDRRVKKREFRKLWQTKINAGARINTTTYSQLMSVLAKKKIGLDRKILADLAENEPATFKRVIEGAGAVKPFSKN